MKPKEFISSVFINQLNAIIKLSPYISFAIMTIGIEFLGKCLDHESDWNTPRKSNIHFNNAIEKLESLKIYRKFLYSHKLHDSLRNGFAHSFVPKKKLTLSSKEEASHLSKDKYNRINLRCEDFYEDFKNACLEIIEMNFEGSNKMNKDLLYLPSENIKYELHPVSASADSF